MFSDTQTLGWKVVPDADKLVTLGKNYVSDHATTTRHRHTINLGTFLARLTKELDPSRIQPSDSSSLGDFRTIQPPAFREGNVTETNNINDAPIDQTNFYLRLNPYLQPNDIVLLGNATPILGGRDLVLPPGAQIIASGQWFSIGHMLPAALGAGLAQQQATMPAEALEKRGGGRGGRTILLDGDGSFQVTAQELATIIRYRVPMTIFLINNAGYAYERQIHGMHEDYNDLAMWDYTRIPFDFGGAKNDEKYPIHAHRIHTWRDLTELLSSESFCHSPGLQFVDVRMDKFDIPEKFKVVFQRAGEQLG
jgi:pyruvate decarboxylase